jgi:hypothetical protein
MVFGKTSPWFVPREARQEPLLALPGEVTPESVPRAAAE